MSRGRQAPKRVIVPDSVYDSILVQRFINKLMMGGGKSKAEKIVYDAFAEVKKRLDKNPLEVFERVVENVSPRLVVKPRRVGGATYQIPVEVSKQRSQAIALQWIRDFCRKRSGKSMAEKLTDELVDGYNGTGGSIKMREDLHKTAEANKAFAHFRF